MLKFLGRGTGFSDDHNGACFVQGSSLVLMDCPLITFKRLKNEGLAAFAGTEKPDKLVIAVTHTHSDHVGGLALTIHYAKFVWGIKVTVIAPSEEVKKNLDYMLTELDGCDKENYSLVTAEEYKSTSGETWLKAAIPTKHVPALDGKCFGYNLEIDGINTIYTGDTRSLDPYLSYLDEGSVLYTECSAYKTEVHIFVDDLVKTDDYFKEKNIKVFLMHLDKENEIIEKIKDTAFELVPMA